MKAILITDLRQRHLEAFEAAYNTIEARGRATLAGGAVRAAASAGWFGDTLKGDDVGDMLPTEVQALSKEIDALYTKVTTLEKNS